MQAELCVQLDGSERLKRGKRGKIAERAYSRRTFSSALRELDDRCEPWDPRPQNFARCGIRRSLVCTQYGNAIRSGINARLARKHALYRRVPCSRLRLNSNATREFPLRRRIMQPYNTVIVSQKINSHLSTVVGEQGGNNPPARYNRICRRPHLTFSPCKIKNKASSGLGTRRGIQ